MLILATAGAAAAVFVMTIPSYGGDPDIARMKDTAQWLAWVVVLAVQAAVWLALLPGLVSALVGAAAGWSWSQVIQIGVIFFLLFGPAFSRYVFAETHDVQAALDSRMSGLLGAGAFVGLFAVVAVVRTHKEIADLPVTVAPPPPVPKESVQITGRPSFVLRFWRAALVCLGKVAESPPDPAGSSDAAPDPLGPAVDRYLELRGRLRYVGGVTAVIVALAILATGGQRNTIVAMEKARATTATTYAAYLEAAPDKDEDVPDDACETDDGDETITKADCVLAAGEATERATRFGVELVWSFGLYYSFVLVLVYLPPYLSLIEKGRRLRDHRYPPLLPGDPGYEDRKKVRDEMTSVLQLDVSATETLRAAALLLVPLLTSFASSLLGGTEVKL